MPTNLYSAAEVGWKMKYEDDYVEGFNRLGQTEISTMIAQSKIAKYEGAPRLGVALKEAWGVAPNGRERRVEYVLEVLMALGHPAAKPLQVLWRHLWRLADHGSWPSLKHKVLATMAVKLNDYGEVAWSVIVKKLDKTLTLPGLWGRFNPAPGAMDAPIMVERKRRWLDDTSMAPDAPELATEIRSIMRSLPLRETTGPKTFRSFLAQVDLWARPAASTFKDSDMKSKWDNALLMSTDELLQHCEDARSLHQHPYSFSLKHDNYALRFLMMESLPDYLTKAYIMWHLDQLLGTLPGMYFWYTPDDKLKMWTAFAQRQQGQMPALTEDFKGWDEQMANVLKEVMLEEVLEWFKRVDSAFVDEWAEFIVESLIKMMRNGLPTGTRMTAFLNSLLNKARGNRLFVAVKGRRPEGVGEMAVGGDDAISFWSNMAELEAAVEKNRQLGFVLSMDKSGFGSAHPDFLKQVLVGDKWTGDPTRQLRSLLWSNESESSSELEYLNTRLDNWTKLLARNRLIGTMKQDNIYNLMLHDIQFMTKMSRETAQQVLDTPTALGGWGLGIGGRLAFEVHGVEERTKKFNIDRALRASKMTSKLVRGLVALVKPSFDKSGLFYSTRRAITPLAKMNMDKAKLMLNAVTLPLPRAPKDTTLDERVEVATTRASDLAELVNNSDWRLPQLRAWRSWKDRWSARVIVAQVKDQAVTNPPCDRSTMLRFGECLAPFVHEVGWREWVLPLTFTKLSMGGLTTARALWQEAVLHAKIVVMPWGELVV